MISNYQKSSYSRKKLHAMQVMELKPDKSVSLVDTDMEADVTPSQEFLDRMAEEHRVAQAAAAAQAAVERAEEQRQAAEQQVCASRRPCELHACSCCGMPCVREDSIAVAVSTVLNG